MVATYTNLKLRRQSRKGRGSGFKMLQWEEVEAAAADGVVPVEDFDIAVIADEPLGDRDAVALAEGAGGADADHDESDVDSESDDE
jgi:hypothetical protein